jgi:hypothetical protein
VTLNNFFQFHAVQQIPLPDGNLLLKLLKPFRGANESGNGMTMLNRSPNNLHSRAAGGAQYNQFHPAFLSG